MKYGFTPGMCSTYMVPKRFGDQLGRQLLFTANQFTTNELKHLNCSLPIYPRREVVNEAVILAKEIADKTFDSKRTAQRDFSQRYY